MAIRTEDSEVFDTVVEPISVDVIKANRNRRPAPLRFVAFLAAPLLQAFFDKPKFQMMRFCLASSDKNF